jgi:hemerythrin-like metal-binding protein
MPFMPWSDSYSVNSTLIDAQHKRLFELVNELHDAMLHGHGKDVIGKTLDATVEYARTHFSEEEKLMEKFHYPELEAHKTMHNAFIQKVYELQTEYRSGQTALSFQVMEFLKDWLNNHILKIDKRYAGYIKN